MVPVRPLSLDNIRQFLESRETKPLSSCPRCNKPFSDYRGVDEEGREYEGRICRHCPRATSRHRWLIFTGAKTAKNQGGYKGPYEDQGNRIFEISFDASGNQAGVPGYRVWEGKLAYTPPFNLEKKKGETVRP